MVCDFCGREIGGMPFSCSRCGGTFCPEHRLPESHLCTGRTRRARNKGGMVRRVLCRIGIHAWDEPRSASAFRSSVIDWRRECRYCGACRTWVEPKKR
jgi:hypothetical protein